RATVRDPKLAALVRKEQDVKLQIAALAELLSDTPEQGATASNKSISTIRKQIVNLQRVRDAFLGEIEKKYPEYVQLIYPHPVSIEEARQALQPDEVLLTTYVGDQATYVWVIPPQGEVAYYRADISSDSLARKVKHLREALDPQAQLIGDIPPFDLATAYSLYETLLKPGASYWRDGTNLLAVCDGPLGFLPLSLLPTDKVEPKAGKGALFAEYKKVPWLAKNHAVTVVPSVASLTALRHDRQAHQHSRAFVGIGDPIFDKTLQSKIAARNDSQPVTRSASLLRATRGISLSENNGRFDMLPPLPDTAAELESIATTLGANPQTDVYLQKRASEKVVKNLDLTSVKVVAFATHGLIPGDLNGLRQPALALTNPTITGEAEDGLLTMGEILSLKLDADWVVLSACNTAAGDGAGAEAVSGLGRAFFYAGTKALLVTNWPIETTSALKLTTGLFAAQSGNKQMGRAEALRQSMLALINGPGYTDSQGRIVFSYAHPIFWAPFSLVGDGGNL
ncbi:MAG: CHAT domain-containing protein, partial [Desulfobulbaceae bacterium]|nr:CHAT domain-containing protein [Desulfobulbaceae bacterium]